MITYSKQVLIFTFSSVLFMNISFSSFAQISTERPTTSVGAETIGSNTFQWEQGFKTYGDSLQYDGYFRMGVSEVGEIRILTNYETKDIVLGAKWTMIQADGNKPGVGFMVNFSSNLQLVGYRIAINKSFGDNLTGYVNAGKENDDWFGDITLGYSLGSNLGTFAEAFVQDGYQEFNASFTYLINDETQLDIHGGLLNGSSSDYIIGFGFARRFQFKESN